jgi:hypothetical protein
LEPNDHATPPSAKQPGEPVRLRDELARLTEAIVADNNALLSGARNLLVGCAIERVERFEIYDRNRHLTLALYLDDGSELEAPIYARITGPLGEVARALGANPRPDEPDEPKPAERTAPPVVLLGCARAILEGRTITDVRVLEIYNGQGSLSFEIVLDDENVIEAPAEARLRGAIAELCQLAGGDPR